MIKRIFKNIVDFLNIEAEHDKAHAEYMAEYRAYLDEYRKYIDTVYDSKRN